MHKEHMAVMEAAMDKRAEATKTFYATLSAEQKKTFDEEHARMDKRGEKAHHMPGGPDTKPAPKQ
jgi:Spy/CpxP family protein refolding chaperone